MLCIDKFLDFKVIIVFLKGASIFPALLISSQNKTREDGKIPPPRFISQLLRKKEEIAILTPHEKKLYTHSEAITL